MNSLKNDKLKSWGLTSSRNTSYLQFTMFVTETVKGLSGYELVWNEKRFSKFFEFVHCRLLLQRQEGALFHQEIQLLVDLWIFFLTLTWYKFKIWTKISEFRPSLCVVLLPCRTQFLLCSTQKYCRISYLLYLWISFGTGFTRKTFE